MNLSLILPSTHETDCNIPMDSIFGSWVPLIDDCQGARSVIITNDWFKVNNSLISRYSYSMIDSMGGDGFLFLELYKGMISDGNGDDFEDVGFYNEKFKIVVYFHEEVLVLLPFKDDELAPGEFSQPEAFIKIKSEKPAESINEVKAVFIVPDGFRGYSWIAMEQSTGIAPEVDSKGRFLINIPETGILESQGCFMPVALAKREFDFYFSKEWEQGLQSIQEIDYNCLSFLQRNNFSEQEILNYGYFLDQVYVFYYRYNNPGRKEINKIFEKDIKGQVFWFRVDTLKNLLKNEPMIPRINRM